MRNCTKPSFCFILLVVVLGLLKLSSCSQSQAGDQLIGTWKVRSMNFNGQITSGSQLGEPEIVFKKDGIFITSMAGMQNERKWSVKDNVITIEDSKEDGVAQNLVIESLENDLLEYSSEDENGKLVVTAIKIDGN